MIKGQKQQSRNEQIQDKCHKANAFFLLLNKSCIEQSKSASYQDSYPYGGIRKVWPMTESIEGSSYIMTLSTYRELTWRSYHSKSLHHGCVIVMAFTVTYHSQYKLIFVTDGYSQMWVIPEIIIRIEGSAYITMSTHSTLTSSSYHNKCCYHACVIMMAFIIYRPCAFL